jgi:VWFA-related protein
VEAAKAAAAAPLAPGQPPPVIHVAGARKFIFYVDNGTLSLKNKNDIFAAIDEFMSTNLQTGDQAMVVNWNGSLHVRQPWTSDKNAINAALKAVAMDAGTSGRIQAEKSRTIKILRDFEQQAQDPTSMVTYEMVESQARSYADNVRYDIAQSVSALSKLLATLSGVDGRKVLILATESLPTQAGAEVFQAFENIRQRAALGPADANSMATGATAAPGTSLGVGSRKATAIADISKYNVSPLIEGLARAANATGVTIYSINPKGTSGSDAGNADLQDSPESNINFANAAQTLDGVNMLTTRTGGVASIGAPAPMALARVAQDLSSYYSIGYSSHPGKSPDRKVEVKVKKPGVTARYRTATYYRTLDSEMSDHVLANHLQSPAEIVNDMGILLQADPIKEEGGKKLMPMRVIIPVDSLTLLPDAEGNLTGGFSVFTSTGGPDIGGAGVNVQSQQLKFPPAQALQMKGRRIGFAVQVPMEKNPKQVSVGVVDHTSQNAGFALLKIPGN